MSEQRIAPSPPRLLDDSRAPSDVARLLAGSYYGQTVQIWSALFAAAILAACLVGLLGLVERTVLKRMGMAQ